MLEVSETTFVAEVKQSALPVVVDFYATWCGPCKMLAPVLEQLAGEYQGKIKFAKVNVDEAPAPAAECQITGVPTLVLFRGGNAIDRMVGMAAPKALRAWLDKASVPGTAASA